MLGQVFVDFLPAWRGFGVRGSRLQRRDASWGPSTQDANSLQSLDVSPLSECVNVFMCLLVPLLDPVNISSEARIEARNYLECLGLYALRRNAYHPKQLAYSLMGPEPISAYRSLMVEDIDENSFNITERNKRGIENGREYKKKSNSPPTPTCLPEKESYNTRFNPKRK